MQRFIVIKGHTSSYPDPIILRKEQEVLYGSEDTQFPNWIFCKSIATSKEGWVPKQILTTPNANDIAIVTKDYSAHELTVNQGDILLGLEGQVMYKRVVEGKSLQEIADELGYSVIWIKKLSSRSQKKIAV